MAKKKKGRRTTGRKPDNAPVTPEVQGINAYRQEQVIRQQRLRRMAVKISRTSALPDNLKKDTQKRVEVVDKRDGVKKAAAAKAQALRDRRDRKKKDETEEKSKNLDRRGCKKRPDDFKSKGGGSRRFVPWCKN